VFVLPTLRKIVQVFAKQMELAPVPVVMAPVVMVPVVMENVQKAKLKIF
jgi:hypothetical protein